MTRPSQGPVAGRQVVSALVEDFALRYRWRTLAIVGGLILAGLLDGLSIGAIIPLITLADIGTRAPANAVELGFVEGLGLVGLAPTLPVLLGIVVVAVVAKAATLLWSNRQVGYSVAHVTADMRRRFIEALLAAGWSFVASRELGRLANTLSSEAERSGRAYEALCQMTALAIQFLVYLALAVLVSWQISLAAALAGVVLVAATSRLIRSARQIGHRQTQVMQAMMARIADGLRGMKPLKAMAEEGKLGAFLQSNVGELNLAARKAVFYRQALDTLTEPLIVLFLAGGVVAAHQLWQIPLATQIVMALLFYRLITRVSAIQQQWQMVSLSESAYMSLRESIAAAGAAREHAHGGIAPVLPAAIRVEHAGFAYDAASVLEDVSLELRPGEITTIVGPSGSGKTTLADCIIGLRRVTAGRILIGATDLERIDLIAWRRAIGYVPQELFLFNQSLRANITLGDPDLGDAAVRRAVEQAGAADFVARLPQGLDTPMGEGGARLSGGQRQRIAIARALVRRPALLILDEATAALDPETEAGICATVRALAEDRVVLAITHQPAWIAAADTVYRLDHGRLTAVKQREDRSSGRQGPARGRGGAS